MLLSLIDCFSSQSRRALDLSPSSSDSESSYDYNTTVIAMILYRHRLRCNSSVQLHVARLLRDVAFLLAQQQR